jgi:hypothetical protein
MAWYDIPAGTICVECKTRPATKWMSEGAMAFVHGARSPWCELCLVRAQLKHAQERAAEIPALEAQVKELEKGL